MLAGQEETHALAHDGKPVSGVQNMESEGEQEPLAWTKVAFPEKTLELLCKGKTPLLALAGQIFVLVVKMKVSSED